MARPRKPPRKGKLQPDGDLYFGPDNPEKASYIVITKSGDVMLGSRHSGLSAEQEALLQGLKRYVTEKDSDTGKYHETALLTSLQQLRFRNLSWMSKTVLDQYVMEDSRTDLEQNVCHEHRILSHVQDILATESDKTAKQKIAKLMSAIKAARKLLGSNHQSTNSNRRKLLNAFHVLYKEHRRPPTRRELMDYLCIDDSALSDALTETNYWWI